MTPQTHSNIHTCCGSICLSVWQSFWHNLRVDFNRRSQQFTLECECILMLKTQEVQLVEVNMIDSSYAPLCAPLSCQLAGSCCALHFISCASNINTHTHTLTLSTCGGLSVCIYVCMHMFVSTCACVECII